MSRNITENAIFPTVGSSARNRSLVLRVCTTHMPWTGHCLVKNLEVLRVQVFTILQGMDGSAFPRLLTEFPACTVHNAGFQSVLLNVWQPVPVSEGDCPLITCSLCPPGVGDTYMYMLRESHLFQHIMKEHLHWWRNLGWGILNCPTTYSEWVSMVDGEKWANIVEMNRVFDSDSDLTVTPPCSPMYMDTFTEGRYLDRRSNSEEY